MKTLLPIAFATAALMFAACEAKVNTTPGPTTEKTNTIITPGSGGTKTENNTTVVNPAPAKTETNTSTTVSPGGVKQSTTTESK
jgi:hypothetical protein